MFLYNKYRTVREDSPLFFYLLAANISESQAYRDTRIKPHTALKPHNSLSISYLQGVAMHFRPH